MFRAVFPSHCFLNLQLKKNDRKAFAFHGLKHVSDLEKVKVLISDYILAWGNFNIQPNLNMCNIINQQSKTLNSLSTLTCNSCSSTIQTCGLHCQENELCLEVKSWRSRSRSWSRSHFLRGLATGESLPPTQEVVETPCSCIRFLFYLVFYF